MLEDSIAQAAYHSAMGKSSVIRMTRSPRKPDQPVASPASDDSARLAGARKFAIEAALISPVCPTHCQRVVILDVAGLSPVTDFFVIATGTSPRQMRSVCDEIEELGQQTGFTALTRSGYEGDQWICVDFVDVLLHVFSAEARQFYDLDNLWGDAKIVEWSGARPPRLLKRN